MIGSLFIVVVVLLVTFLLFSKRKPKKFPPGPLGFPLLGHLPKLGVEPQKTLFEWKKVYGPVIGLDMGSYPAVAINDAKMVKEVLNSSAFSGRPSLVPFLYRSGGVAKGILFTSGQHWQEQRRFSLHYLRDFGFGKKSMESKILDEAVELVETLKKDGIGKEMEISYRFNATVLNALWSILVGQRFELDDPELQEAVIKLTALIRLNPKVAAITMFVPFLCRIAPKLSGFEQRKKTFEPILAFIQNQLKKHNKTYIQNQPQNFLDVYMDETNKTKDPNSSFHEKQNTIVFTLLDLFIAGAETTSTTLAWLFAYMTHFPKIQEKMHEEIMNVIGTGRLPSLNDRAQMPYTEAVINETMRFSTIVPFTILHNTVEDVEFHGHFIPKDTLIIPNLYSVHFDKEIWGDPENFRPERFLDAGGKFKKNEYLIPFSAGKRVCLGEGLARDELFLFTTCLFQKLKVCRGSTLPDLVGKVGQAVTPNPFNVILEQRQ